MTDAEFEQSAHAPEAAPAEGETAAKAKNSRVKYELEVLDELPEAVAAPTSAPKRAGSAGWRGRIEEVVALIESGDIPLDDEGVSKWAKLATYTSGNGAENAYKSIAKRQRKYKVAVANDETPEEESVLPDGWNAEVEHRRLSDDSSILAIRMWRKEEEVGADSPA